MTFFPSEIMSYLTCLCSGLNIVALIMIFLWLPETKQRTLEELDYVFAVPTGTFVKYQTGTWLPWFIQRHIFRRKDAKLKPLYHFEGVKESLKEEEHHKNVTHEELRK